MKIKIVKTEIIDFDMDEERKRITVDCDFDPHQEVNLLKICDLFEQGKYKEAAEFADTWGRDEELECPEVEFINPTMWDVIHMSRIHEITILDEEGAR